mgnify:CR=1 FL=1
MTASAGWTNIFIYPGYRFKVLDGLITNFHLPESTLIMLVSALAGREHILAAYEPSLLRSPAPVIPQRYAPCLKSTVLQNSRRLIRQTMKPCFRARR